MRFDEFLPRAVAVLVFSLSACTDAPSPVTPPDSSTTDAPAQDVPVTPEDVVTLSDVASDVARDVAPVDVTAPRDAGMDAARDGATGCAGNAPSCVAGTPGGTCNDVVLQGVCEGGRWACPSGTIPIEQCACAGRPPGPSCACVAGGWRCDAGVADATNACAGVVLGGACSPEGQTCGGPCTNPCQFCNIFRCAGGRWGRVEVPPLPPDMCRDAGADTGTGVADAGRLNCDPRTVACNALPPPCPGGGQVREVRGGCWGDCVLYDRCQPIACNPDNPASQCPTNTVCFRTTRMCGLPVL